MINLKCPYCGFTWEPRVKNPRSCPNCKRRPKEGYMFEEVNEEIQQEWMYKKPEPALQATADVRIFQCPMCVKLHQDVEAPILVEDKHYCLLHGMMMLVKSEEGYGYRGADPLGMKGELREKIRNMITNALAGIETEILPELDRI